MAWKETARRAYGMLGWLVLGFTVTVVAGGAVVRATGSGDGCGASWPRCGGEVLPSSPRPETLIEFTHRAMTAAAVVGVLVLVVLAFALWPRRSPVRVAATLGAVFLVVESLLGASLVLFGWVDQDVSAGRLVVVPLHLTNTFLLLAAIALTAWWGSGRPAPRRPVPRGGQLVAGAASLVIVGAAGALNALADTVIPVAAADGTGLDGGRRFLDTVRVVHPFLAVVLGLAVAAIALGFIDHDDTAVRRLAGIVGVGLLLQMFLGMANIVLVTPLGLQLAHLAVADGIWIAFTLLVAAVAGVGAPARMEAVPA